MAHSSVIGRCDMSQWRLIAAKELTAAKLLDLELKEFLALVEAGDFPDGREIAPGCKRWDTELLRQIVKGELASGDDSIQW